MEKDLSPNATDMDNINNILNKIAVFGKVDIKSLSKRYCKIFCDSTNRLLEKCNYKALSCVSCPENSL